MALDPVPFVIGGDAEHGPDVFRQALYVATGGNQGVGSPGDLKVTPLDVPGAGVKIAAGGGTILNRTASQESYGVRNPIADLESIKITPTGSGAGRSDIVICRVDNPYVDGNAQAPADPVHGPYNRFDIIQNVPAGTRRLQDLDQYKGLSAIELCRIDLPKSTGTVTSGMITDLRDLTAPKSQPQIVKGTLDGTRVTLSTTTWQQWPQKPITGIKVPDWATHAVIRVDTTIRFVSGDSYAVMQSFLGPAGQMDGVTLYADQLIDSTGTSGEYRQPLIIPSDGYWPVPEAIRGTTVQLTTRARGRQNGGIIGSSIEDYYFADITFVERIS